jgi:hypothetical protein
MTQLLLEKAAPAKVLEIGTGCGYQTAVLAKLVKEVYTLERIAPLMDKARRHLRDLRFYNVRFKHADGHAGYPEGAPYDGILMAASATHVPEALKMQLAVGGRKGAAGGHRRPVALRCGPQGEWIRGTEVRRRAVRAVASGARMIARGAVLVLGLLLAACASRSLRAGGGAGPRAASHRCRPHARAAGAGGPAPFPRIR